MKAEMAASRLEFLFLRSTSEASATPPAIDKTTISMISVILWNRMECLARAVDDVLNAGANCIFISFSNRERCRSIVICRSVI